MADYIFKINIIDSGNPTDYGHLLGFVISQLDKPNIKDITYYTKTINVENLKRLRTELKARNYSFVIFFYNDKKSIRIVTSLEPFSFIYSADKEIVIEK